MGKPGDNLHALIKAWTGTEPHHTCKCDQWIANMNQWGVSGCRERLDEIVEHLMEQAKRHATEWRAAPVDDNGTILNTLWNRAWTGAFLIPGAGVLLEPFVRAMVNRAINQAESES